MALYGALETEMKNIFFHNVRSLLNTPSVEILEMSTLDKQYQLINLTAYFISVMITYHSV